MIPTSMTLPNAVLIRVLRYLLVLVASPAAPGEAEAAARLLVAARGLPALARRNLWGAW